MKSGIHQKQILNAYKS